MIEKDKKKLVLTLYESGYSISEIARLTSLSYHQVYHIIKYSPKKEQRDWRKEYLVKLKEAGIADKLRELLTYKEERKGEDRYLPFSEIKRRIELELAVAGLPRLKTTRWYEFLHFFVVYEFGIPWTVFIAKRKDKILSKSSLSRDEGVLEIDATGFVFQGKLYSVMLAMDLHTGYILSYTLVENKERNVTYYNRAFDRFDVAKFLQDTFSAYGVPQAVKSDNEKIIKNKHILEAFQKLGVKHIKTTPGQPQQKLIERTIREIKAYTLGMKANSLEELLDYAINRWNKEQHRFKHYDTPIIPEEIFTGYEQRNEEEILRAFAIRERRKLKNNTIVIEKVAYEFIYPGELEVEVLIYLDDNTKAEVYHAETKEFLGIARKISKSLADTVPEQRQKERKLLRIERRQKEYVQEIQKLEEEKKKVYAEPEKVEIEEKAGGESKGGSFILELSQKIEEEELW